MQLCFCIQDFKNRRFEEITLKRQDVFREKVVPKTKTIFGTFWPHSKVWDLLLVSL